MRRREYEEISGEEWIYIPDGPHNGEVVEFEFKRFSNGDIEVDNLRLSETKDPLPMSEKLNEKIEELILEI